MLSYLLPTVKVPTNTMRTTESGGLGREGGQELVIGSDLRGCGGALSDTISTLCGDEGRGNTIRTMHDDGDEGTLSTGGGSGLTAGMVLGSGSCDL
jgi:hypothetical protein